MNYYEPTQSSNFTEFDLALSLSKKIELDKKKQPEQTKQEKEKKKELDIEFDQFNHELRFKLNATMIKR
jgi:hypothetical protein